jgi:NAD(P)-dependent dehydrogenase (short-subunit alcohol dehydrogenase family)
MTGANSGIGLESSKQLVAAGCTVGPRPDPRPTPPRARIACVRSTMPERAAEPLVVAPNSAVCAFTPQSSKQAPLLSVRLIRSI